MIFSRAGVSTRHSRNAPNSCRDSTSDSTDFTENRPFASSVVTESVNEKKKEYKINMVNINLFECVCLTLYSL